MKKRLITILLLLLIPGTIFYLLNFDFKGNLQSVYNSFCQKAAVKEGQIPDSWLNRYEIEIQENEDYKKDIDQDGLDLIAEYNNSTNPLLADTDQDGFKDGKEVRDGYNPVGEGRLDLDGDKLPDFWEKETGLNTKKNDAHADNDNDGLANYLEYAHLTNPLLADTDGDGFSDNDEIKNGYDPVAPGEAKPAYELIIKKINVVAPIVWSLNAEEALMLEDLKRGVARYPDTGIPGQRGNAVISGHSSNYAWVKGNYNYIFKDLNNLNVGDTLIIKTTQKNGKSFEYTYKVQQKSVVAPDDAEIFKLTTKPSVTLVTCWPLRTNWKRLIIRAELQ